MTIETKLRVDFITPDLTTEGSFIVNGSIVLPDDHELTLGHTYAVTVGDEVTDPIPVPEPGTELNPPPLPGETPPGVTA
jgi:hypothetical protein